MNKDDITVIICCAGMGTSLGIGTTKALVNIEGKPLIIRQLEMLDDFDDVRVVVGYQAERVIETVNSYRQDVMFAFNYDYKNTGVAASLSKAMIGCRKYILSIDGDVLINTEDFSKVSGYPGSCICGTIKNSDESIYLNVDASDNVIGFTDIETDVEWCGINKFQTDLVVKTNHRVTDMLEPLLPLPLLKVRAREIDTPEDFERMLLWYSEGCKE